MTMQRCLMCGEGEVAEVAAFSALPRVTSDCKPWPAGGQLGVCTACGGVQKYPNAKWLAEIAEIYGAYQIYHLSAGAEQQIFAAETGAATPRSRTLVDYVVRTASLPARGRLIDVGCGNGAALRTFSAALPGWTLHGSELSDSALPGLRTLPNFAELYVQDLATIPGTFDLVAMNHALEHMTDPAATLREAAAHLCPGGTVFVEVPDTQTWPFDLLVADHLSHFTPPTLGCLAARVGLAPLALSNTVLTKEITFLGRHDGQAQQPRPAPEPARRATERAIGWLNAVRADARRHAASRPFGIFGTSISGMWLYGELRDSVAFFVDEDRTRIGGSYEGRPILGPAEAPADATVYIPLIPEIARAVARRLVDLPARFVPVPDYAD